MEIKKKICIYCMGEYGIRLCYMLHDMGYPVSCFGDQDKRKCGYAMLGASCIHYDDVCKLNPKEYLIIVAKKNPEQLIVDFKRQGFTDVYSDKEMIERLKIEDGKMQNGYRLDNLAEAKEFLKRVKEAYYSSEQHLDISFGNEEMRQMLQDCILRKQNEHC